MSLVLGRIVSLGRGRDNILIAVILITLCRAVKRWKLWRMRNLNRIFQPTIEE